MIKIVSSYTKRVTEIINQKQLVPGCKVTKKQVEMVLNYFIKNLSKTIQKRENEILLNNYMWIFPVRKNIMIHNKRVKKTRRNTYITNVLKPKRNY